MNYLEPEKEPNHTPILIILGAAVAAMLFFALKANAYEVEKPFSPVGSQYEAVSDPIVTVERYAPQDYHNDETVLIAGERYKPVVWVAESRPITVEEKAQFLPPVDNDVKITATIESDTESAVNYPL